MAQTKRTRSRLSTPNAVLIPVGMVCGLVCWVSFRSSASAETAFADSLARLRQMRADAARIETLRSAPRLATERIRPNDEFITAVESALGIAGVPLQHWIAHVPSPAMRVPKSPYQMLAVRLSLEDVSLRQVVEFAHVLVDRDPGLSVRRLRLTARENAPDEVWNAELELAYLVYSPQ